jgi:hypothetical protein
MWRPADGSGRRGARGGGQQGGEQSRDWGGATRGSRSSRRWSGSQGRGSAPAAGGRAEQHVLEEEEERGGVRGAYLEISEISRTSR